MRLFVALLLLSCNLVTSRSLSAAVMVSNLSESTFGYSSVSGLPLPSKGWTAVQFTTGSGDWQLSSVTARTAEVSTLDPDGLVIEVRAGGGMNPGNTVLGTFTPISNIGSAADYVFSTGAPISLSGLTNYWLVARYTNPLANYGWAITPSGADNGVGNWSLSNELAASFDDGASWVLASTVPILSLDASAVAAVPESGGVLMLAVFSASLAIQRIRKREISKN